MSNKIGICITCYNNELIIEENLLSALQQKTNEIFEVYIIDDGSIDKTPEILTKMNSEYVNLNIVLAEHQERGVARFEIINKAIDEGCNYILFLDSDMKLDENLIDICMGKFSDTELSSLVIPEQPVSEFSNFMTRVKLFERSLFETNASELSVNSIEAARFWKTSEYLRSGGVNKEQISFEETQPTIRIRELGGKVLRANKTKVYHDEGKVTFSSLFKKKNYYFREIDKTLATEKNGLFKAASRWYFFRSYLYSYQNLLKYIKSPVLFFGVIFMYLTLTLIAVKSIILKS